MEKKMSDASSTVPVSEKSSSLLSLLRFYLNRAESRLSCDTRSADHDEIAALRKAIQTANQMAQDAMRLNWLERMDMKTKKDEKLPFCVIAYPECKPFWGDTFRQAIDAAMEAPSAEQEGGDSV